mgnify:CR=1 FL=1
MEAVDEVTIYFALLMAVSMGLTAWRLVAAEVKFRTQVDGVLGACLVASTGLFLLEALPGAHV